MLQPMLSVSWKISPHVKHGSGMVGTRAVQRFDAEWFLARMANLLVRITFEINMLASQMNFWLVQLVSTLISLIKFQ